LAERLSNVNLEAEPHERWVGRIAAGRAAHERINRGEHFDDWVAVADALVAIREEAMTAAGAPNNPKHPRYRAEFKRITQREAWVAGINDTTRSHCYWLIDHLPAVRAWRDTLGPRERTEWNHPSTVKRNYEAFLTRLTRASGEKTKAEADALKPPMRQDDPLDIIRMLRSGVLPPGTSMAELADVLDAALNYNTLKRLHTEIGKKLEAVERQDKIEAGAKKGVMPARKPATKGAGLRIVSTTSSET
jgi:hypothetical protein